MIPYIITYDEQGIPKVLKFYPDWCDSKGLHWDELGKEALKYNFTIPNWHLDGNYLVYNNSLSDLCYIPKELVEEAQFQVTLLMDKLLEWDNIRKVFKGLEGD